MAKFIICDCARANWGKTTTLVEVINLFKSTPVRFSVIATTSVPTPDQWFVFHDAVTSKDILIQTAGDNSGCFTDTKNYLKSGKCVDIIICASHTKGASRVEVSKIAHTYSYSQIELKNFAPVCGTPWSPQITTANQTGMAQAIFNLALSL